MAKELTLPSGQKMPTFGLGTWKCQNEDAKLAVRTALDAGYRLIDTAYSYLNEDAIGEVLEEYIKGGKIKRKDIFISTKLGLIYSRPSDVKLSMRESLRKLRLDYVDMFLYHFPVGLQNFGDPNNALPIVDGKLAADKNDVDICDVWKVMEELVDEGKTKNIGISNFNSDQVESICNIARIKPAVNQVECHAYFPQNELQVFCEQRGIYIEAYAPIGSPKRMEGALMTPDAEPQPVLLEDDTIVSLSKKYNKTPAQILLRNLIQRGTIVISKSATPSRIVSNIQLYDFNLSDEDMIKIGTLKRSERLFKFEPFKVGKAYPFNIPF